MEDILFDKFGKEVGGKYMKFIEKCSKNISDEKRDHFVYEKICMLVYSKNKKDRKKIQGEIRAATMGWDSFIYETEFIEPEESKIEIEDGAFKCYKCGGSKTTSNAVQTRSADEPMTIFVSCEQCGNKWRC